MTRPADPYLTGVGIGCVLLGAYALAGQGLGASGAFASAAAVVTAGLGGADATSPAVAPYLPQGLASPLRDWLVWELAGAALGAFLSAWRAGRLAWTAERGPRLTRTSRLAVAVAGGAVMGIGAKFARGCTSGQALSGGALLSAGSWIFIIAAFATAYAVSPLARRLWL